MGKRGPCRHCGVTSTPLWRNGPPEKPILCNACGSRWRIKGSLENYTPLHSREPISWEEPKVTKVKSSIKPKGEKLQKRKRANSVVENECENPFIEPNDIHIKNLDEDACNRSSSGSVITYSESSGHFRNADANDWTGPAQSNVPLRKRSVICPKPSLFEKLTKDLYSIWHDQQSADTSEISDADLVFEGENPMGSVEIGHGGILLRYPCSETVEESEASSLHIEEYIVCDAHLQPASFPVNSEIRSKKLSSAGIDKLNSTAYMAKGHTIRDSSPEKLNMLQDRDSLLWSDDLDGKIHKVVDGGNRAGRDSCKHFSLMPTEVPYKSQYQPLVGFADNGGSFLSTSPPDNSEFLLDASCSASFQDAELLYNNRWFQNTVSSNSQTVRGAANEESLSNVPASSLSRQLLKQHTVG